MRKEPSARVTGGGVAQLPAVEQLAMLRNKTISSRELFAEVWRNYEDHNDALNAVVYTDFDRAQEECMLADEVTARGYGCGPLHGLPMTVKDAIAVKGMVSTGGAELLREHVPARDAPSVARLKSAGAIVYGKTNVPRWSGAIQTFNALHGVTNNPWDQSKTCGGSSGGSAVAVATGMSCIELGTDIGGSIRIPASHCGVFAHKPSFGLVSQRGYLSHDGAGNTDADINVFGPLARSVEDLALVLDVLAGPDDERAGAWSVALPAPRARSIRGLRIGVWFEGTGGELDPEVRDLLENVVSTLEANGVRTLREPPPIDLETAFGLFLRLVHAAVCPALAPEDRGRVGGWHSDWIANDEDRAHLRETWSQYFSTHDVVLMPVMPVPAFPHDLSEPAGERRLDVAGRSRTHTELVPWLGVVGVAYLPSTVVPIGRTRAGLPVGMQVVGPYLEDRTPLLASADIARLLGGFQAPVLVQPSESTK